MHPFAHEIVLPATLEMYHRYGASIYSSYGFLVPCGYARWPGDCAAGARARRRRPACRRRPRRPSRWTQPQRPNRFRISGSGCSAPGARRSACARATARICAPSAASPRSPTSAFTTSSMTTSACTRKIADGKPVYNFSYVDQVYDGLLASGVRPFVELSFMPRQLALRDTRHTFWYHPVVVPAEGLRPLGCADRRVRPAPGAALRHRGGQPVVLRGVERAESRLLGRPAEAGDLLDPVRPYRPQPESGGRAPARRRTCDRAGRMGRGLHPPLPATGRTGRLHFEPRLWR